MLKNGIYSIKLLLAQDFHNMIKHTFLIYRKMETLSLSRVGKQLVAN